MDACECAEYVRARLALAAEDLFQPSSEPALAVPGGLQEDD